MSNAIRPTLNIEHHVFTVNPRRRINLVGNIYVVTLFKFLYQVSTLRFAILTDQPVHIETYSATLYNTFFMKTLTNIFFHLFLCFFQPHVYASLCKSTRDVGINLSHSLILK